MARSPTHLGMSMTVQEQMEIRVRLLREAYEKREKELMKQSLTNLRKLGNMFNLPHDLNKTQLVKHILLKEFRSR